MTEHAQPQSEELKKHGDELANVVDGGNQKASTTQQNAPAKSGNKSINDNNKE